MAKKKSSFHMGDEFNGNGKKTYLRATQHNTYAPLPQNNVRLTPNFNMFVPVAIGALPIGIEEETTLEEGEGTIKATGSISNVLQVVVEAAQEVKKCMVSFNARKIALTTGSYLHSNTTPKPKTEEDIVEGILPQELDIPYAEELTVEQVEKLLIYAFDKLEWSTAEDTEYIAKLMIEAGMITRLSIEYFLLTCSHESGKGSSLLENGGSGDGKGFIQLTKLTNDTWKKLAVQGNQWRKACGKDLLDWIPEVKEDKKENENTDEAKDEVEIKVDINKVKKAVIDREQLAWEGSIYYWSVILKAAYNSESLNYYVKKYECAEVAEKYDRAGLFFATQCFVNGAYTGDEVSLIRAGDINDFIIVESPEDKIPNYDILKKGVDVLIFKETAPVGSVGRAKCYMSYYEEEDIIWQFSQEILDRWAYIPS